MIDIKEANPAAATRAKKSGMPKDNGERVVEGAINLSPAFGDRMMAGRLFGPSIVIRELMPQDLKLESDRLSRDEAVECARYLAKWARYLAEVVGKAHARQMDPATRRDFAASFKVRKTAKLDAPSWLWSSVVELGATHETAYLQHCRRYALAA